MDQETKKADAEPINPALPLPKTRHENFAQAVSLGKPAWKAYKEFCYSGKSEKPSRAVLQSGASQLVRHPLVRARIYALQQSNAEKMRMSAEEIIERIEDLAKNATQEKVRLDSLMKLYEIGGYRREEKVNVKYVLQVKANQQQEQQQQQGDAIPI